MDYCPGQQDIPTHFEKLIAVNNEAGQPAKEVLQ